MAAFYLDLFLGDFLYTFYIGKSPLNTSFGRIFLELFPSIAQANPSLEMGKRGPGDLLPRKTSMSREK